MGWGGSADLVVGGEVLEHVHHVVGEVHEVARVLLVLLELGHQLLLHARVLVAAVDARLHRLDRAELRQRLVHRED